MNTLPKVIPASQARSNFYALLDEVGDKLKQFTITLRGKAKVVLMHPDEVSSWEETMDILADKKLIKDIRQGINDITKGKVLSEKEAFKTLNVKKTDLQ